MPIEILFQNEQVIAVSKPSGQMTIPGRGDAAQEPLNVALSKQLRRKLFVIHRLDLGASGLVLFAKDAASHRALSQQFELRQVQKTYRVLVQGSLTEGGHIDQPLKPFGSGRMGIHPFGKASQTDYRVLETFPGTTLLEVSPHTGRRHQIRVHLYSIGHPVLGDTLYGKDRPVGGVPRLMLHAQTLVFKTPAGETLSLAAEVPDDFSAVVARMSQAINYNSVHGPA